MVKIYNPNAYELEVENGVAKNSLVIDSNEFVTKATWVVDKALAGETIVWISATKETFASDNQTVWLDVVLYNPFDTNTKFELPVSWETITFSWALVTSNVVDLDVNWVAMTSVPFNSSDAQTLADIATQLVTDFPTVIASASAGTNSVKITPVTTNSSVVITNIVVTLWAGQATWTVADNTIAYTDEWKFYDITTGWHSLDYHTAHASSGQVKLYRSVQEWTYWVVKIANT